MILKSKNYITFKEVITGIVKVLPIFHSVICAKVILFLKWKCQGRWLQKVISFWYGFGTFSQNYKKKTQKRNKLFNQFSNICDARTSFDLKMQGIFETSNQREYLKCGKIIMRSQFRYWKLLNQFDNFCHPNN